MVTNNGDDPYFSTLESIMRITLAGFGGALAGLSFARRRGGSAIAAAATRKATKNEQSAKLLGGKKRLKRQTQIIRSTPPTTTPYQDRELPTAWAIACMSFAGVVEVTRKLSPTTFGWELARELKVEGTPETLDSSITQISDYIIGGAIAGALFKGSAVRTKTGTRLDASIMGNNLSTSSNSSLKAITRPLSGILPGATLGLVAGISMIALDRAQIMVEEKFGNKEDNDNDEVLVDRQEDDTTIIPQDIKQLTNEELMKEIERIKSGNIPTSQIDRSTADNIEVMDDEHKQVHDLLYGLGFRKHSEEER